jgi:glycosyltransferase involved in cell wall biosynthesis
MLAITAVIPAYNEASRIGDTIKYVNSYVDEVIVVDDASKDSTAEEASRNGARVFKQASNKGYVEAIKLGFEKARGDIVVTLDADGEFLAREIPKLVKPILEGYADMVQGRRDHIPRPSERLLTWLAQKKANVGDSGTGFRALRTELARTLELRGICICGVLSLEVIAKGGKIVEVPISTQKIEKPRRIAWFHIKQFFYLVPWLLRKY